MVQTRLNCRYQIMNSKERSLAALRCEQPDKVPITELSIDEPVLSKLGDILGVSPHSPDDRLTETDILCGVAEQLSLDWVMTWPRSGQKPISENLLKDVGFEHIIANTQLG